MHMVHPGVWWMHSIESHIEFQLRKFMIFQHNEKNLTTTFSLTLEIINYGKLIIAFEKDFKKNIL